METEVVSVDLNKVGHRKTARFDISGSRRVGVEVEDPEPTVLANKELEKSSSDRIQQVSEELKRLTTLSIQQQPAGRLDRAKPGATHALKGLKTISKKAGDAAWNKIEKKFDDLTKDTNGLLPRSLFVECIGMNKESKEFGEELFNSLTRRRNITSDSINKAQLKELWDQISDRSFDSRLQTFFDMVDKDADGRITEDEVRKIINLSASANNLVRIQEHADEYAALIMTELDPEKRGYILIENLEKLLSQAQEHNVRGETRNLGHLLSQQLNTTPTGNPIRRWYEDFKFFLMDNWQRCWVMVLWIGVMAGLFTWKYIQYKDRAVYKVLGHCVCIAKGSAETLKFNMALILLPVCRNTITWLRTKTGLGVVVPFDDNLNFHKVIAVGISIGVGLHAISHLACDFPRLIHATEEEYRPMQQYFGDQATNYWHFVKATEGYTGIIMTVLMMIAFTLATPWLRRNKFEKYLPSFIKKVTGFNAFWYTHHLFIIVYTLLIVHGIKLYLTKEWYKKTTWMYLAVPISLYACERLMRSFRSRVKSAEIHDATFYPGNVMALHMSKPQGFKYKSGQYMFVKCAAVSPFEWHPFSITSAPDDKDLSVHIKSLGDWTKQLKIVFSEPPSNGKRGLERVEEEISNYPKVVIDGPYGAPSQEYKKYDVVLLVGLGIGATPMISIVKDIVNNMKAKEEEESALENGHTGTGDDTGRTSPDHNFKTKKAYFYWMTKEQGTFDWFRGVMNEAAEMDKHGVIEMHNYCTSVFKEGDVRSTLITLLQSLHHAKNGVDVVTDIRVKTHFARPNWRQVYKDIALKHTGSRIGVFYCGAPAPTQELKQLAHDFSHRTSTKFDFHKENF